MMQQGEDVVIDGGEGNEGILQPFVGVIPEGDAFTFAMCYATD